MARPEKEDRGSVASETLTLRLTAPELTGLRRLVELKQVELSKTFPGVSLSLASFVRGLIHRELAAIAEPAPPPAQPVEDSRQPFLPTVTPEVVKATHENVSESKRVTVTNTETPKPTPTLPERLQLVQARNLQSFRQIGIELGLKDGSAPCKWVKGDRSVPAAYEAPLDQILRKLGV